MLKSERISCFDYCKGLLIIFVVLGHVMPEKSVRHIWLYSWHMPAFFLLNGMLLAHTNYAKRPFVRGEGAIVKRGIRNLLFPYYIYGGLLLIARWADSDFAFGNLGWQIKDLGLFCGIGATWFLPCLFFAQIIYYVIAKISEITINHTFVWLIKIGLATVVLFVTFTLPNTNFVTLVFYRSFVAAFFVVVGDMLFPVLMKIREIKAETLCMIFIGVAISSAVLFYLTGQNDAALNVLRFGSPVLFIMNALSGSAAILSLAVLLEKSAGYKAFRGVPDIGKESLMVMGTHQIVMLVLKIPILDGFLINVLLCMVVMIVEFLLISVAQKERKRLNEKN